MQIRNSTPVVGGSTAVSSAAVTLGDLLVSTAEQVAEQPALVTPTGSWTYDDLVARAQFVARGLVGVGVRTGDHVGVLMPNGIDCMAATFGVALAGAVLVPINVRYRSSELRYVLEDADLVTVLTNDEADDYVGYYDLLRTAVPGLDMSTDPRQLDVDGLPCLRSVVVLGSKQPAGALASSAFTRLAGDVSVGDMRRRAATVRLRDIAILLYTSGTTSSPRGCLVTHEAIVRDWLAVARQLKVTTADRCWNPAPFFHITGIGVNLLAVASGATVLSALYFEPDSAFDLIEREGATVLYPAYPPITQAILNHPRYRDADLRHARVMLNVAPPDTMRQMQAAMPQVIQVSTYGGTETCGVAVLHQLTDDAEVRATTCGRPLAGAEIRIVDPRSGTDVACGDAGEILMRGVNACEGYYKDPQKTAQLIDEDGWLHTGDRGAMDKEGRMSFLGRSTDMLKVGGENVAPAEVESYLSTHPAVHLVQVVGVPDATLTEVPAAFVELKPGHDQVSEQEIIDYCVGKIARFKIPRHIRFVTDWPMSATKVQKNRLQEQLIEELDRAAGD